MPTDSQAHDNHQAIRDHINHVLCELENLEPNHFELSERVLQRSGVPCAVLFVLHGPRQLQVSAVWEWDRGVVWFYNAVGKRCRKTQIEDNTVIGTHACAA